MRGGPEWVVTSASDLARVGLLIATGGRWMGKRLISQLGGNTAMGGYEVNGWGQVSEDGSSSSKDGYFSFGKVATKIHAPESAQMADWIGGPVEKLHRYKIKTKRED